MMFKNRYRIVTDGYAGFEAQVWRWWFPMWRICYGVNTASRIERAREMIARHRAGLPKEDRLQGGEVIEYVD